MELTTMPIRRVALLLLFASVLPAQQLKYNLKQLPFTGAAVTADFNGDGKADVAVVTTSGWFTPAGTVQVFLGNGDGSFGPAISVTSSANPSLAVGDFNHDGKPDLLVITPGTEGSVDSNLTVTVHLGNGDGTFQSVTPISMNYANINAVTPVNVADFNGDGNPDVLFGSSLLMLGNGDGTFKPVQPARRVSGDVFVADFNGDGKPDIAVGAGADPIAAGGTGALPVYVVFVFLNNGDATFQPAVTTPQFGVGGGRLAVGDLNGDGKADIVIADAFNEVMDVFLGNGDGSFHQSSTIPLQIEQGGISDSVFLLDVNGDGHKDIVGLNGVISVFLGHGDGTFSPEQYFYAGPDLGSFNSGPNLAAAIFADFNGDHLPDALIYSSYGPQIGADYLVLSGAGATPSIPDNGVVNAATAQAGPVAAGSIVSVYGTNLSYPGPVSSLGAIALGAQLQFNGQSALIFYASPQQVNAQVPWEAAGSSQVSVVPLLNGNPGTPVSVTIAPFAPGLFAMNGAGTGQGIIWSASNGMLAAPLGTISQDSEPAQAGSAISFYANGLGAITNQPASGAAALSNPLSVTTTTPTVTIGGVSAQVLYSGLAPQLVGVYQVNVVIPVGLPSGSAVPLALTIGGVVSNTVTLAVQ